MRPSRHLKVLTAVLALAVLAACGGGDDSRIALEPDAATAANDRLYPAFRAIQVQTTAPEPPLDAVFEAALAPLRAVVEDGGAVSLWTTGEADADAGCLAGGRLFITQGMLSWIESADELSGVLAAAMSQCPAARSAWTRRDRAALAPVDDEHPLLQRYRDYRLPGNAALYEQLTLRGCGRRDCLSAARDLLIAAAQDDRGLLRLGHRLQAEWPDAAWLDRIGGPTFPPPATESTGDLRVALAAFHGKREGLGQLAAVKRTMYSGQLGEAYRQVLRARRALDNEFEAELVFAELSLLNFHPDSAERSMERLAAAGEAVPQSDYLRGVQLAQSRSRQAGERHLQASLTELERISAHFHLGILLHRAGELERALTHYRVVAAAEPGHPQSAPAASYIAQIEAQ